MLKSADRIRDLVRKISSIVVGDVQPRNIQTSEFSVKPLGGGIDSRE